MEIFKKEISRLMAETIARCDDRELCLINKAMAVVFLAEFLSFIKEEYRAEETIKIVAESKKVCEKYDE